MTNSYTSSDKSIEIKSSNKSNNDFPPSSSLKGIKLKSFKGMIETLKKDFPHPFLDGLVNSLLSNQLLQKNKLEIEELQELCSYLRDTQEKCIIFLSHNVPNSIILQSSMGIKILFSWIDELYCLNSKYNFDLTIKKMLAALHDDVLISEKLQNLKIFATLAYIYKMYPDKKKLNNSISLYIDIILLANGLLQRSQKIESIELKKISYDFINIGLFFLTEINANCKDNFIQVNSHINL